jgi:uncharacterized membrane protein
MLSDLRAQIIKQVGMNGQVCLGKEYAGKQIQISKMNDGTLLIKPGQFIPDNERWLHTEARIKSLDKAIEWAENNPRRDNFDEIVDAAENNAKPKTK